MDQPESPPDHAGGTEQPLDLHRVGIRCNVEILGRAADKQIANGPADDVGVKLRSPEAPDHPQRIGIHVTNVDPVLFLGVDVSLLFDSSVFRFSVSEKQSVVPVVRPTSERVPRQGRMSSHGIAS